MTKKEVHLRLIKRISLTTISAACLIVGAALFFEAGRLEQHLVSGAVKEGLIYSILYTPYLENPSDENLRELERKATDAISQTPYIYLDFLTSEKKSVTHLSVPPGNDANQAFINKGIIMIPSDGLGSARIISGKHMYLKISTPVKQKQSGIVSGYISGIYHVSSADLKAAVFRLAFTSAIAFSAVIICGFFCYLGFLLLHRNIIRSVGELSTANMFLLKKLAAALAKSDVMDEGHGLRILIYAISLAEKIELSRKESRALILAGFLHDLEMLPINLSVLIQADSLSKDEYKTIRYHPKNGAETVEKIKWLKSAAPVIRDHHEKYDGSGYPNGIKREKINTAARILAIADAFDALTSKRPYRQALPVEEALLQMERESGSHFDPVMLSTFTQLAPNLHTRITKKNEGELNKELDRMLIKYLRI